MPLHVRDERALKLARKLAEQRGTTLTTAVLTALENELQREAERLPLGERLDEIAKKLAAKGNPEKGVKPDKATIDALWGND